MDDGEETLLSISMSGREMPSANARQQKCEGTITIPVFIGPDEFFSFCMRRKIPLNNTTRGICQQPRGGKLLHGDVSLTMEPLAGRRLHRKRRRISEAAR